MHKIYRCHARSVVPRHQPSAHEDCIRFYVSIRSLKIYFWPSPLSSSRLSIVLTVS